MTTKVLAIDDSRTIRVLVQATLQDAGFDVITADDGLDGLEKYSKCDPDVVITDINMPNLDGFGVIEALRSDEIGSTVPILVLTTESSAEQKARARDGGATGWIVKPFDDVSLIGVLRRVTGHGF